MNFSFLKNIVASLIIMVPFCNYSMANNDLEQPRQTENTDSSYSIKNNTFEGRLFMDKNVTKIIHDHFKAQKTGDKERIEKFRKRDEELLKFENKKMDTNKSENLVLKIYPKNQINGTIMDRFIQKNKMVTASKVDFKKPYIFLKSKTLNLENKEVLITNTIFGKTCLHYKDNILNIKFCNFKNIEELKKETSNFFKIDGFLINKTKN